MGISSSKSKTVSKPADFAQPYLSAGLAQTQQVYNQQSPRLNGMADTAGNAFQSGAASAFGTSPFVQQAQAAAGQTLGGKYLGQNPGASTFASAANGQNPAMPTLAQMAGGSTSPGNYNGIGDTNPALASWQAMQNGGTNSAVPGFAAIGYGTGSMGAGDGTLESLAAGGGPGSPAGGYDQAVLGGKYLNAQPSASYYADVLGGKYLNAGNPYLESIVQQGADAATKAANQRFGAAGLGAGLSSAYTDVVSKNVADSSNSLRYADYDSQLNRMSQVAGQSDAAFANERGNMESASGRISSNYNMGQDRSMSAAQALSNGSRADVGTRLSALGQLSGADQQQFANRATAAGGLASAYASQQGLQLQGQQARDNAFQTDRAAQLGAASTLGSQWNQGQQTQLAAAQAQDSAYGDERSRMLQALGLTGSLEDAQYAGIAPYLNLGQFAAQVPFSGTTAYNSGVGGLTNGYGTTTGTTSQSFGSVLGGLTGAGLSAWAGGGFKGV